MSSTNDIYDEAIRNASLHSEEYDNEGEISPAAKFFTVVLIASVAYVGFSLYTNSGIFTKDKSFDKDLVVKLETSSFPKTKTSIKKEVALEEEIVSLSLKPALGEAKDNSDDKDYLSALASIENEISLERKSSKVEANTQKDLSLAMNSLTDDDTLIDNTKYTEELQEEIGLKSTPKNVVKAHKIIVKKGDTLETISNQYYGDAQNYKRIIASNDSLDASGQIYEGQTIILPY